jgi:hypothetical protein
VKRITIPQIRELPWFQENLPQYLQPLPATPSIERPGARKASHLVTQLVDYLWLDNS